LRSEIYSDYLPLWSNLVKGQNNVYPASATEIHNHVARLKVRETSGVTASTREVESAFWHPGKLSLSIEALIHCIARTGLSLARSTSLLVATFLSETVVATLNYLANFFGPHLSPP
jgi:hypothetical protein